MLKWTSLSRDQRLIFIKTSMRPIDTPILLGIANNVSLEISGDLRESNFTPGHLRIVIEVLSYFRY